MKIYLDTNIIIRGGKLRGSDRLRELSKKGKIKLFISDYVSMEIYQGLLRVFRQKNELLNTHKEHNKDFCRYPRLKPWHLKQFKLCLTPFGQLSIHPRASPWNSALRVV